MFLAFSFAFAWCEQALRVLTISHSTLALSPFIEEFNGYHNKYYGNEYEQQSSHDSANH